MALNAVVLTVMMIGLIGLSIPGFPGLVVVWLAALGYGLANGLGWPGWGWLLMITILMIVGNLVDNLFMGAKTLQGGGSWWTLAIGTVAGLVGSIFLSPIGGILIALLAVFLFEFYRHKDWQKALTLTKGVALGCGWAFVTRFGIGVVMIGLWLLWANT